MRKSLLALAVSAFGIGTTEFIILGLLPDLARDFSISIPRAGTLVTAYARRSRWVRRGSRWWSHAGSVGAPSSS